MRKFSEGQVIDGHRIVKANLSKGAFGVVHEAIDTRERRCALKVLNREFLLKKCIEKAAGEKKREKEIRQRTEELYNDYVQDFKTEFQNLCHLGTHPNVASPYSFGLFEDHFYFTTEFVEGKPIATFLRGKDPREMITYFVQLLEGLDFIHKNELIHLDIKSENVLVVDAPRNSHAPLVKIIDFGITMSLCKYTGEFIGSIPYIAPEVALGCKEEVDARADLFSAGVLMYCCITWGKPPFYRYTKSGDIAKVKKIIEREKLPSPPSRAYRREEKFPSFLDTIIMSLIQKKPKDRFYTNARAVINALVTHSPEAFKDSADVRGAYLIPEGNSHIGRNRQQRSILSYLERILGNSSAQPPIVVIEGNQGMGKTHLLQKIVEACHQKIESLSVHTIQFPADEFRCDEWSDNVSHSLEEKRLPIVILLDNLDELSPQRRRTEAFKVSQTIKNMATLAWERHEKPELFAHIPPILLCLTYNSSGASFDALREKFQLPGNFLEKWVLEPFTMKEVKSYLEATPALRGRTLPEGWIEALYRKTSGVPSELKEHLEKIDSQGMLFSLDGKILIAEVEEPSIKMEQKLNMPASTQARLRAQFFSLRPKEQKILKLIAVWNFKHSAPQIKYEDLYFFFPEAFLSQELESLVEHSILTKPPHEKTYEFTNRDYFSTFIYEMMKVEEREYWHKNIAEFLCRGGGDSDLAALHRCYETSGPMILCPLFKLGKKNLLHSGSLRLAASLFEHGLEQVTPENPKLYACLVVQLMDVYQKEGAYSRAAEWYQQTCDRMDHLDYGIWRAILSEKMVNIHIQQHRFDKATYLLGEVRQRFGNRLPLILQVVLVNDEARILYERARVEEEDHKILLEQARELFEKSERLEEPLPSDLKMRIRNNNLGLVLIALGDYEGAVKKLLRKLKRHQEEKNLFSTLATLFDLSEACRAMKRFEEAKVYAIQAVHLARQTSQGKWLLHAHHALANIYHDADEFKKALEEDDCCLASLVCLDDPKERLPALWVIWTHKGHCYKELRDFERAAIHFQAVLDAKAEPIYTMSAHEGFGELYFLKKEYARALRHLDAANDLLQNTPLALVESHRSPIMKFRVQALKRLGRIEEARELESKGMSPS